jgi:hypothetical protein
MTLSMTLCVECHNSSNNVLLIIILLSFLALSYLNCVDTVLQLLPSIPAKTVDIWGQHPRMLYLHGQSAFVEMTVAATVAVFVLGEAKQKRFALDS